MNGRTTIFGLAALAMCLAAAGPAHARPANPSAKDITLTTKSNEAKDIAYQVFKRIDLYQVNTETNALAQKAATADPSFAMAHFLVAITSQGPAARPHMDKALELSKSASDGERRYIEAVNFARSQQMDKALPALVAIANEFPAWRPAHVLLAQIYLNQGKVAEAKTSIDAAIKLDPSVARPYAFLGNYYILKEDYGKARESYANALARKGPNTAPFLPHYGTAFTYVYEGDYARAIKVLQDFRDEYAKLPDSGAFPPVFVWNSIARLQLESGKYDEALKSYEAGYATVPGSKLTDEDKTIWMGRLHHGRGRVLAKMGKIDEAWKEAEYIKKLIDDNGERGKQFVPSYHYIAGYVKLEAGDYAAAIEHLKSANGEDEFHKLLLARAYEKAGDAANARKAYGEVVASKDVNLERALAYAEAKRKA
jgi:tetratricopeptide (TPR) repeat protein